VADEWIIVAVRGKPWELYDLDADRTEGNDLASKHPETIAAFSARRDDWARRSKVLPFPPGGTSRKN
jgi:arylsulfatase A-like enzyme